MLGLRIAVGLVPVGTRAGKLYAEVIGLLVEDPRAVVAAVSVSRRSTLMPAARKASSYVEGKPAVVSHRARQARAST